MSVLHAFTREFALPLRPEATVARHDAGWPDAPLPPATWRTRLMEWAFRHLTPTFELPWLENFGQLNERLCRGAQPGRQGFQILKAMGVETVINLRVESDTEAALVRGLGMHYRYFPLDPVAAPTHAQTLAFLRAICDPAAGRVFFHCYHGADRTGVLAGCYRLAHDGWPLAAVLDELDQYHFHHAFQRTKRQYLHAFDVYWRSLDPAERDDVLHRCARAIVPGVSADDSTAPEALSRA